MYVLYNVGLKTILHEGLSEPEFNGDLVYKFRKIVRKTDFPDQNNLKHTINRYKTIGNNMNILRQFACAVVNPIMVNYFAFIFNCTTMSRPWD